MVLCLTYAYVTKVLCFYVTTSSKPVSSCLTQKPHPVRYSLSERRGAGGEAVGFAVWGGFYPTTGPLPSSFFFGSFSFPFSSSFFFTVS